MPIRVSAPNGATVSFPDGTDSDTINSVMAQNFGGAPPDRGFLSGVRNAVTGEDRREPGIGEFSFGDLPDANVTTGASAALPSLVSGDGAKKTLQQIGSTLDAGFGAPRWKLEAGFALDANPNSRAEMIRQNVPTAKFRQDRFGNTLVQTLDGQPWRYVNRPGFSQNDVEAFLTEGARHIPDAILAALPQGWLARLGLAGAGAAANTAASQGAASFVGGQGINPGDVAMSGLGGAVGQGIGDLGAVALPAARSAVARAMDFIQSRLPPRAPLRTVVQDAAQGIKQAEDAAAQAAVARDPALARQTQADEFGIPLTQGQAKGDIRAVQREDDMLTGGSTLAAQNIMDRQTQQQADKMADAALNIATRGRAATGDTVEDAGLALQGALSARREALQAAETEAYGDAFDAARADAILPSNNTLPAQVHAALAPEEALQIVQTPSGQWAHVPRGVDVDSVISAPNARLFATLPEAQAAADSADSFVRAPDAEDVIQTLQRKISAGRANFGTVERARQDLNAIWQTANNQGDIAKRNAITRIIGILDNWVETNMTSQEARALLANARQIHKERMQLYGQSGPDDIGGKFVERAIELERTGQQIADSIIGAGNRPPAQALATVRRIKEIATTTTREGRIAARPGATAGARGFRAGELPTEIQALREALLRRIVAPLTRRDAGKRLPIEGVVSKLRKAIDGEGSAIMRELFTDAELDALRRYIQVLEYAILPDGVGRSGTPQALKRMVESATNGMLGRITGLVSIPVEQVTSQIAAHSAFNRVQPRAIYSGDARPVSVAAGAALAPDEQERLPSTVP